MNKLHFTFIFGVACVALNPAFAMNADQMDYQEGHGRPHVAKTTDYIDYQSYGYRVEIKKTQDELQRTKEGALGLFFQNDKLYCKISSNKVHEVLTKNPDRPLCTQIRFIHNADDWNQIREGELAIFFEDGQYYCKTTYQPKLLISSEPFNPAEFANYKNLDLETRLRLDYKLVLTNQGIGDELPKILSNLVAGRITAEETKTLLCFPKLKGYIRTRSVFPFPVENLENLRIDVLKGTISEQDEMAILMYAIDNGYIDKKYIPRPVINPLANFMQSPLVQRTIAADPQSQAQIIQAWNQLNPNLPGFNQNQPK